MAEFMSGRRSSSGSEGGAGRKLSQVEGVPPRPAATSQPAMIAKPIVWDASYQTEVEGGKVSNLDVNSRMTRSDGGVIPQIPTSLPSVKTDQQRKEVVLDENQARRTSPEKAEAAATATSASEGRSGSNLILNSTTHEVPTSFLDLDGSHEATASSTAWANNKQAQATVGHQAPKAMMTAQEESLRALAIAAGICGAEASGSGPD